MRSSVKGLLLTLSLPFLLSACQNKTDTATANAPEGTTASPATTTGSTTGTPASATKLKVALLTPGPISDAGWNASAYEGLQLIKKELGAEVSHQQTKGPAEFEADFRNFAQAGNNLVFAHGSEYGDAALKVAKDFPKTTFVISAGGVKADNVLSMVFDLGQTTYLCGEIAALMSKTGKIGCVGGINLPSVKSTFVSFEGGAKAAKPGVKVTSVYTGSFEDINGGKQATVSLINAGNDFIIHNADQAGLGVVQAVKENKAKGVMMFGTNKNQNGLGPDVILASATLDVPKAFLAVAKEAQAGPVKGELQYLGIKEGVVDLAYNDALKSKIPAAVLQKVEKDKAAITAGTLKIPR